MIQRVQNVLEIRCDDVNFSTSTNIEFYIRQDDVFKSYTPSVVSAHVANVTMPKSDMMAFSEGNASLQFALTDANGMYVISNIVHTTMRELLKEAGYGS